MHENIANILYTCSAVAQPKPIACERLAQLSEAPMRTILSSLVSLPAAWPKRTSCNASAIAASRIHEFWLLNQTTGYMTIHI